MIALLLALRLAVAVHIVGFKFQPAVLHVKVGSVVTWTNEDQTPHVLGGDFAVPVMDTGEHQAFQFTRRGTYHYFCTMHPTMTGEIIVE